MFAGFCCVACVVCGWAWLVMRLLETKPFGGNCLWHPSDSTPLPLWKVRLMAFLTCCWVIAQPRQRGLDSAE